MSIRTLIQRYMQHVQTIYKLRIIPQSLPPIKYPSHQINKIHLARVGESHSHVPSGTGHLSTAGKHLSFLGAQARRLFVNNILKRVTNTLTSDLRRRAVSRHLYGDSAPFFALVGVSLASGTGILTKEDELEGVCWEIRDAVNKLSWNTSDKLHYATFSEQEISLKNLVIGLPIAKGSSAIVHAVRIRTTEESLDTELIVDKSSNISSFPLALKMMFNYDAESNSSAILTSMYKETIPAQNRYYNQEISDWEKMMSDRYSILPPHPNIVDMYCVFADRVPSLPLSQTLYPDALPSRINPQGSGRNMSLFLLMKRYDITLKEYLADEKCKQDIRRLILLFAQLLEGVYHINSHGIAHRDLKSDNILLDLAEEHDNSPSLVITDFGCCLADKMYGLQIPYNTYSIDKGGNSALMAPEIITAEPGPFTKLNYTKSDLWTVGAIAYEIFSSRNPFYSNESGKSFTNFNYKEIDLPPFPENVPRVIVSLIKNCLKRNVSERLSVEKAATVMQLYLWAPSSWLNVENEGPSSSEILQWLLCLTSKILHETRANIDLDDSVGDKDVKNQYCKNINRSLSVRSGGRRTLPEYQLIASFLSRVGLNVIRQSLKWIKQHS